MVSLFFFLFDMVRLKELEAREETLKLVAGLVGLDKVRSQLRMISLRREFLEERDKAPAAARGTIHFFFSFHIIGPYIYFLGIPTILINAIPGTPPPTLASRDITSPRSDGWGWQDSEHDDDDPTSPFIINGTPSSSILLPSPELAARERSVQSAMYGRREQHDQGQKGREQRANSDASMLSVDVDVRLGLGYGYGYVLI